MLQTIIDPPSGWQYGFPKPIPVGCLKSDSLLRIWLLDQGYPANMLELALKHSRYWSKEIEDDSGKTSRGNT
jgi:hypothetical protein